MAYSFGVYSMNKPLESTNCENAVGSLFREVIYLYITGDRKTVESAESQWEEAAQSAETDQASSTTVHKKGKKRAGKPPTTPTKRQKVTGKLPTMPTKKQNGAGTPTTPVAKPKGAGKETVAKAKRGAGKETAAKPKGAGKETVKVRELLSMYCPLQSYQILLLPLLSCLECKL